MVIRLLCGQFGPKNKALRIGLVILAVIFTVLLVYDCMFGVVTEDIKVTQLGDYRAYLSPHHSSSSMLRLQDYDNNTYWGVGPVGIVNTREPVRITYLRMSKYVYNAYAYDDFYKGYREVFDHHFGLLLFGGFFYILGIMALWHNIKQLALFIRKKVKQVG